MQEDELPGPEDPYHKEGLEVLQDGLEFRKLYPDLKIGHFLICHGRVWRIMDDVLPVQCASDGAQIKLLILSWFNRGEGHIVDRNDREEVEECRKRFKKQQAGG